MPENESGERPPRPRTAIRQHPERDRSDPATVASILAEGFVCHVAFVDGGVPHVLPTIHAPFRGGVVLHGATGSRMMRVLASGAPVCLTVTLVDGLVLARSAMHHSMNYR